MKNIDKEKVVKQSKPLQESEKKWKTLVQNIPDLILILSHDHTIVTINHTFGKADNTNVIGTVVYKYIENQYVNVLKNAINESFDTRNVYSCEILGLNPGGTFTSWYEIRIAPIINNDYVETVLLICRDISDRKKIEKELLRVYEAVDSSSDAIGMSDPSGSHFYQNRAFTELFEYTVDEVEEMGGGIALYKDEKTANDVFDNIMSGRSWTGEIEMVSKSGRGFPVNLRADAIRDSKDNIIGLIGLHTDITERKEIEKRLKEMTIKDDLTGLYNRRGFFSLADQQLKLATRSNSKLYLFYHDVDNMKWINDTYGHRVGDQALIDTSSILKECFRESDIIARIGGDEFVVLTQDVPSGNVEDLTERLYKRLDEFNKKAKQNYNLSISVGISCFNPSSPCSLDLLLTLADGMMYKEKRNKSKVV